MITLSSIRAFFIEVMRTYWVLVRILVPALVLVRILEQFGATQWLGALLSPFMSMMGLPNEFGLVWAASILTNIYTAMAVFYELATGQGYTVAQMSTLGVLLLLAHALPVEGMVAKHLGVSWRLTLVLRIGGGLGLGLISAFVMTAFDFGGSQANLVWQPQPSDNSWLTWSIDLVQMLLGIALILASLMALLRLLRWIGFEAVLGVLLTPLMKIMSVKKNAASMTIIGLMLGLSFGAGLLIAAAKSGRISSRDMKIVACFLGLCHSVIEDTLLILLLGADIWPILVGRFIFSCLVIAVLARTLFKKRPQVSS